MILKRGDAMEMIRDDFTGEIFFKKGIASRILNSWQDFDFSPTFYFSDSFSFLGEAFLLFI